MAFSWVITALLFSLVLSSVEASSGHQALLHGSVSCLDCKENKLNGIRVLVGCDGVKKTAMAVTDDNGHFKAELPQDSSSSSKSSPNCLAKLLGGPTLLCSSRKTLVSNVVAAREDKKSFTLATPLAVYTTCPTVTEAEIRSSPLDFGSSKILGVPPEWGFPPVADYIPIMPIIGIP